MEVQIRWRDMAKDEKRQAIIEQLRLMAVDGYGPRKAQWEREKPAGWTPSNNFPKLFGKTYARVVTEDAELLAPLSVRWQSEWADADEVVKLADGHHNPPIQPCQIVAGDVVDTKRFWHTGLLRWVTMPVRVGGFA